MVKVVILCYKDSEVVVNFLEISYKFNFWGERYLREIKIIFIYIVVCFYVRYFNINFGMIVYWFRLVI